LKELLQYRSQHIVPYMRERRQELDRNLSAADREELAQIRMELATLRAQQLERLRASIKTRQRPSDAQKAQTQANREQQKRLMEQVHQLAQRNAPLLQAVENEVKGQREKWLADMQALAGQDLEKDQRQSRRARRSRSSAQGLASWSPSRFLLLDPTQPDAQNGDLFQKPLLRISPNPVTDKAVLSYHVSQAGPVTIDVLDQQGNPVRRLIQSPSAKGGQRTTLDLSQLSAGVYICRLTTAAGAETIRFVKQ
jgi:hypothetical protein